MKSEYDYKLTSRPNRAELLNSINALLWFLIFRQIRRKDGKFLSLLTGKGKILSCDGVDDDGKLYVTDFPTRDPNFRNLQHQLTRLIHTISKFSSLYIPANISFRHILILELYYTILSRYAVTSFQKISPQKFSMHTLLHNS